MKYYASYITDLDGTLVDSTSANIHAYDKAFNSVGLDFNIAAYRDNFGLRFDSMMDILAPTACFEARQEIRHLKRIFYTQNYDLIRVNQPLASLLAFLRNYFPIGLATTADQTNAEPLLENFELAGLFSHIIYGNDVSHGKPDPECYEKIILLMNINPSTCLIFEDSKHGIEAARASGADVLIVKI